MDIMRKTEEAKQAMIAKDYETAYAKIDQCFEYCKEHDMFSCQTYLIKMRLLVAEHDISNNGIESANHE